jgi:microcin C transport system substrate-binding protein
MHGVKGWAARFAAAVIAALLLAVLLQPGRARAADAAFVGPAIAMHGATKYGADFAHFDYVNPEAPKGGAVRLYAIGTYDSFNSFITKGMPADGLNLTFETLLESSRDEAFSEYGLIAERIEMPADRSWVIFTLRAQAHWHDGTPITVADVLFSFDILKEKGNPFYKLYYTDVVKVEDLGERRVRFSFRTTINRELPLIIGQLPILSKAYYTTHPFDQTTLEPPLGSGPYRVESFESGRSITYRRAADYWGADLSLNRGRYNFDSIRWDYYRDDTVALEAFKAHEYDFRQESVAKSWASAYVGPQFDRGDIIRAEIPHELPTGMQGFAFNIRRPFFADRRVREALGLAFDFEWANHNLFYDAYTRTESYFSNSELAAKGPPSASELAFLEPLRAGLPPEVFTQPYKAPASDGSGNNRANLRQADQLLEAAGYKVVGGKRIVPDGDTPFTFELLLVQPAFERVAAPFVRNLARLGITCTMRVVDSSQYVERLDKFDFDMVVGSFGQSLSPGNEQREYWGSAAADVSGSRNIIGIKSKAIDALIDRVIAAPDRERLVSATRALDRALLWGHYVIPQWHLQVFRVAYWNAFGKPALTPKYDLGFIDSWWIDPAKAAVFEKAPPPKNN